MRGPGQLEIIAALLALGWMVHGGALTRRLARAHRDPLTGLRTRASWNTRAQRILTICSTAVVLLVDLDDFKAINDTHGHAAGDAVLVATATRLSDWCGWRGIPARLGGDEFAAVTIVTLDAGGLGAALNRPVLHDGALIPVSASVGFCRRADLPQPSLADALAAADAEMYLTKGKRKNRLR
ncbi:GGDEF domain-containing protein [Streptomyces sp. LP05-1]|uniref:GGDEF domain-containing protein n=1 Tax=Streptomyces pyxinae TaxID=2970734 RepID=A0ABT2CRX2_9ACTN|nr:GGDEF domain-containing protein [Streptomyces sp. LP05-1]MCS0639334.1 GGDEF domain-containing protein [Streptomyces sp. LP05-1]